MEGDFKKADKSLMDGIKTLRMMKDQYNLISFLIDYSECCKKAGKKDKQKSSLEEALSIAKQLKNKAYTKKIEKKLAKL
jgi:hypothetical protein